MVARKIVWEENILFRYLSDKRSIENEKNRSR